MLLPYANLQVKHWNPGATAPLILPITIICNTSDEDLHNNIRANSRRPGAWFKSSPAHDGVAILCGSGPSLADTLDEIRARVAAGGILFAMNGAAKFLAENDLLPDHQVIIDPREMTADLVGPAKHRFFASQVHPACFERAPDATVWHLQIEGIDDLLPEYDSEFCLLGGAASVGNTACCLAYAMGFRELHMYGYDSCHKGGNSHAFRQEINDGDPCARVLFNGKEYLASLTMKLQAERFQETARHLVRAGCAVNVHGYGLLPDIWNTPKEELGEREKYQRMWTVKGYADHSPGEEVARMAFETLAPTGTIIDFGCGTGRGGLELSKLGLDVMLVDFVSNSRDPAARHLPFVELDLCEPMPLRAAYGFCVDVMEHMPPEKVPDAIKNIMASAEKVFFQVSTVPDNFGAAINQDLHLTVQPGHWWEALFQRMGYETPYVETRQDRVIVVVKRKSP